jgi:hypothetical protein
MRYGWPVTKRSPIRWSFAVALAAHALAIVWVARARTPASVLPAGPPQSLEIEVAAEPPPPPPVEAPPLAAPQEPPSEPVATRDVPRPSQPSAPRQSSQVQDTPVPPVLSAEPAGSAGWTFSPTTASAAPPPPEAPGSAEDVALRKATAAGVGAVVAEATKKAADRARKPLTFSAHEMGLGLVPGGQYASIARTRVRNSLVPGNDHALLEFWTDNRGIVARVRVLGPPGETQAWGDVASALVEDARAIAPLKVPSNSDGFIVTLDVTSVMKTLSGGNESDNALVKALRAVQNPVDSIMDAKGGAQRVVAARVVGVEAF